MARVLVITDDPDFFSLLGYVLQAEGFLVSRAIGPGDIAIDEHVDPAVIILDTSENTLERKHARNMPIDSVEQQTAGCHHRSHSIHLLRTCRPIAASGSDDMRDQTVRSPAPPRYSATGRRFPRRATTPTISPPA